MGKLLVAGLAKIGITNTVAVGIAQLGASLLISRLLSPRQSGQRATEDELARANSTPPKRFVWGKDQIAFGTPAPAGLTQGGVLYCCHILNSRPSASVSKLIIDRRDVPFTGDIYDFTGPGADADHPDIGGFAKFWVGLGDQTGPPDEIMSEIGDASSTNEQRFWPTDGWTGNTVVWSRFRKGGASSVSERWVSRPPGVAAIGDWSRVWDPRDSAQDPDDPATWTVSANAWLCILDALRNNPLARWGLDIVDVDSFVAASDDADATRARLHEDPEPRWRIGGTSVFAPDTLLLDVLGPMVAATGGDLMISGAGIKAIPALAPSPVITLSRWDASAPMRFKAEAEDREIPKAVQARWPQPEAKWETQTMTPVVVPGRTWLGSDDRVTQIDLEIVPFAGQVQHLQQIEARKRAQARALSFVAGGELLAAGAEAGDRVSVDFGPDYASRNIGYIIEEISPGQWLEDDDGAAFRQGVRLRERDASVYAWDPETDELPVYVPSVEEYSDAIEPPSNVVVTQANGIVDFTFSPSPDERTQRYEFQWRRDGVDPWRMGGTLPADGDGTGTLGVQPHAEYDVRVRAGGDGVASEWVIGSVSATTSFLTPPTDGQAIGGVGEITVSFTGTNDAAFQGVEIWGSDTDDIEAATELFGGLILGAPNSTFQRTETALGPNVTRFYFARSVGTFGAVSAFTASVSATTDA